jgi:hypothetical protein
MMKRAIIVPTDRLESELEDWAREEISAAGGRLYKIRFRGRRGAPDDLAVWPRDVKDLIEFKRKKDGRVSQGQSLVHQELALLGCIVWLLDTRDLVWEYIALRTAALIGREGNHP